MNCRQVVVLLAAVVLSGLGGYYIATGLVDHRLDLLPSISMWTGWGLLVGIPAGRLIRWLE